MKAASKAGSGRWLLAAPLLIVIAIAGLACDTDGAGSDDGEAVIDAAVTIYATEFFTREVGGDRVRITPLLPAGTDAHDFEPTPGDIRTITESDIVVFNHPAFEGWIADAIAVADSDVEFVQLANLPDDVEFEHGHGDAEGLVGALDHPIEEYLAGEIDADQAIVEIREALKEHGGDDAELAAVTQTVLDSLDSGQIDSQVAVDTIHDVVIEHLGEPDDEQGDEEGRPADPHVWINPAEAIQMVNSIRDALVLRDPEGASYYEANATDVIGRLTALDNEFASGLQGCEHSVFVASHLAYGHLAGRYGLEQIGLSGLSDEAESGPQHVTEVINSIRELGLTVILIEPFSNQALAETAARETGAQLLPLHPLESLTQQEQASGDNYFTVMERNLASLRTALNCSG